jgi:hypothetical protein
MTGFEPDVLAILHRRLAQSRQSPYPPWDDEAVREITRVARRELATPDVPLASPVAPAAAAPVPDAAGGTDEAALLRDLLGEVLGSFKQGPNGWGARVKADQIAEWRERLDGEG